MNPNRPTTSDRLRRGSPVTQPSAATQAAAGPVRVKPVRLTVDLSPSDYEELRDWAYQARMSHSDVLRALVRLLQSDPSVAQQVRNYAPQ